MCECPWVLGFLNGCWRALCPSVPAQGAPRLQAHGLLLFAGQGLLCQGLEGLLSWKLCLLVVRCPLCIQVPLERGVRPLYWVAGDPSGPRPLRKAHRPLSGRAVHTQVHVKPSKVLPETKDEPVRKQEQQFLKEK